MPTFEDLRKRYEILSALAKDTIQSLPPGVAFGSSDVDMLQAQLKRCEEIFNGPAPQDKRDEIRDKLDEVAALIAKIRPVRLTPPREVWEHKHEEARQLLEEAIARDKKTAEAGYANQLTAIRAEGEKAYSEKNQAAWTEANRHLDELSDNLRRIGAPPPPQADPMQILLALGKMLEDVGNRVTALLEPYGEVAKRFRAKALTEEEIAKRLKSLAASKETQERIAAFHEECKVLGGELKKIKPTSPNWQGEAWGWKGKLDDLTERVNDKFPEWAVSGGLTEQKS